MSSEVEARAARRRPAPSGRRPRNTGRRTRQPSNWPSCHSVAPGSVAIDDRGGPLLRRRELGGGARLVVVLEEADQALLVVEVGVEVAAHRARARRAAAGRRGACRSSGRSRAAGGPTPGPSRPRRRTGSRGARPGPTPITSVQYSWSGDGAGPFAPRAREDVVQHQHRHVAAHAVGLLGDVDQRVGRGLAQAGRERVELGDVRPRREVRVAAAGDDGVADREEARRLAGEVVGGALDEVLGMVDEPGVVGGDVVGHEVDEQPHPALGQRGPGRGQAVAAAEAGVDLVAADAVGRADDVGVGEIGERGVERRHLVGGSRGPGRTPAGLRSQTPISHTASTPGGVTAVPLGRRARRPASRARRRARRRRAATPPCSARR